MNPYLAGTLLGIVLLPLRRGLRRWSEILRSVHCRQWTAPHAEFGLLQQYFENGKKPLNNWLTYEISGLWPVLSQAIALKFKKSRAFQIPASDLPREFFFVYKLSLPVDVQWRIFRMAVLLCGICNHDSNFRISLCFATSSGKLI
jgi:hypothetical protein